MKHVYITLVVLSFSFAFMGCSTRLGDCTVMSTKNIHCENVDLTKLEQNKGVIGKDIRFWGIGSNMKDAADKALEKYDSNLLIDAVVYYETFPLICGGYVVKGNSVKVPYERNSEVVANSETDASCQHLGNSDLKYKIVGGVTMCYDCFKKQEALVQ